MSPPNCQHSQTLDGLTILPTAEPSKYGMLEKSINIKEESTYFDLLGKLNHGKGLGNLATLGVVMSQLVSRWQCWWERAAVLGDCSL